VKLIIFGDSITSGFWDEEGGWPIRIQREVNRRQLERGKPFKDYNMTYVRGVSGDTSRDLKQRLEDDVQTINLDENTTTVINIGFNDSIMEETGNRVPIEETRENLENIINNCQRIFDQTILVGFTPVDESQTDPLPNEPECSYLNSEIKRYEDEVRKIAEERGLKFIPLFDKLDADNWNEKLFDGVHPNTEGHREIFEVVRKPIFDELEFDLSG
jgi:lysophospholipase L1-like esterase